MRAVVIVVGMVTDFNYAIIYQVLFQGETLGATMRNKIDMVSSQFHILKQIVH